MVTFSFSLILIATEYSSRRTRTRSRPVSEWVLHY